jgi:hypothetical protein
MFGSEQLGLRCKLDAGQLSSTSGALVGMARTPESVGELLRSGSEY